MTTREIGFFTRILRQLDYYANGTGTPDDRDTINVLLGIGLEMANQALDRLDQEKPLPLNRNRIKHLTT